MSNLLMAFTSLSHGSVIGTVVETDGRKMLVAQGGSVFNLDDSFEQVTDFGAGIFTNQRDMLESNLNSERRKINDYENKIRQFTRNIKAIAKQYDSLTMPQPIGIDQEIDGVLGWASTAQKLTFTTKVIVASDVVASSGNADIVVGALTITINYTDNHITVKNHNRMVTGYDGAETPHPHWTPSGICLGEYSTPFEECLSEGMVVEAIEQLMLHFTSYNSSDGAGVTAQRWALEPDVENDIIARYETITHGELLS